MRCTTWGCCSQQRGELGEAETWYRRAADAGHSEAMFNLGMLLEQRGKLGRGRDLVPAGGRRRPQPRRCSTWGLLLAASGASSAEAETWYRRAADAGHSEAMSNLGVLLARAGPGRGRDLVPAGGRRRPQRGDVQPGAAARAAGRPGRGRDLVPAGGRRRPQRGDVQPGGAARTSGASSGEAEAWYRRAADAGHSGAMYNLGVLLEERGELGEAETWYRRAADAGDSGAMFNLGVLLHQRGELGEAET